jgi:hypothetical protein
MYAIPKTVERLEKYFWPKRQIGPFGQSVFGHLVKFNDSASLFKFV